MKQKHLRIAIIGAKGLVGKEIHRLLLKRGVPSPQITPFGRGDVINLAEFDVAFLAAGSLVSKKLLPLPKHISTFVIDLSSCWRNDPSVPLILPHVNDSLINQGSLVACPNCVVSILLTLLGPLHVNNPIRKIWMTTYQAASGAGKVGLAALKSNKNLPPFPHPLKENLFLHESPQNALGYSEEEEKIIFETKKILASDTLKVNVRSVRIGVKRAHAIAATVTFTKPLEENFPPPPKAMFHPSPTPKLAEKKESIFYAPPRIVPDEINTYDFWVVGDQLLRGAALNAVEIYETWLSSYPSLLNI